jgi:hypothetical protein
MTKKAQRNLVIRGASTPTTASTERERFRSQSEKEMDTAVERVYRTYGPNLSDFFKAVQGHLQLQREEKR